MSNRLNKNDVAAKLVDNGTVDTKKEGIELVESVMNVIQSAVVAGDSVAIPDFGKFERYEKLNGTLKPKFTPFSAFKDAVSG